MHWLECWLHMNARILRLMKYGGAVIALAVIVLAGVNFALTPSLVQARPHASTSLCAGPI